MGRYYRLDGHEVVDLGGDVLQWGKWSVTSEHRVAEAIIGRFRVSTVFLGINHQWLADAPPMLFETMIFGAGDPAAARYVRRCSTWAEAEAMHADGVAEAERRLALG